MSCPGTGLLASANWNLNDGNVRHGEPSSGPRNHRQLPAGVRRRLNARVARSLPGTLQFQNAGTSRLPAVNLIDVAIAKNFDFGRQKLTLTLNCFNILNINTVLGFASNDISKNGQNAASNSFNAINNIVPPARLPHRLAVRVLAGLIVVTHRAVVRATPTARFFCTRRRHGRSRPYRIRCAD